MSEAFEKWYEEYCQNQEYILSRAEDVEAALDIMRGFRREHTSIMAHYEEMNQVKHFMSDAYLKGDGEQFYFSHIDTDEAEEHQQFALKVTVLVVREGDV